MVVIHEEAKTYQNWWKISTFMFRNVWKWKSPQIIIWKIGSISQNLYRSRLQKLENAIGWNCERLKWQRLKLYRLKLHRMKCRGTTNNMINFYNLSIQLSCPRAKLRKGTGNILASISELQLHGNFSSQACDSKNQNVRLWPAENGLIVQ